MRPSLSKHRYRTLMWLLSGAMCVSSPALAQEGRRDHRRGPMMPGQAQVRSVTPQNGAPGTTVTIEGRFADDVEVVFGRQPVTLTAKTPRSITFVVPRARPGQQPIVLRSGGQEIPAATFQLERGGPAMPPPPVAEPPIAAAPPPAPLPAPAPEAQPGFGGYGRWGRGVVVSDFTPREGPAGTIVTIHGRHFGRNLTLVYGDQTLAPTSMTEDTITFAVPRQAGENLIVLRRAGRPDVAVGTFAQAERARPYDRDRLRAERRAAAERRWQARQRALAKSAAEREAALQREEAALRQAREARRQQRMAALRTQWEQKFLAQEDVREELALHADRSARLSRALRLAEARNNGGLAIRIQVLIDTETARHDRRMADLKTAYGRI